MGYRPEPAFQHGQRPRCAVLMVNLGTPDAPDTPALRRYLAEFLWDPRVVELPRALWWLLLHGWILRTRPRRSAAKYARIWTDEGSPLAHWTRRQAEAVGAALASRGLDVIVRHAMRYGAPGVGEVLDGLRREGVTHVLVWPMYPQYAAATTASVHDAVMRWSSNARWVPHWRMVGAYHDAPAYIDALAARAQEHWRTHGEPDHLVLSFHGLPHRSLEQGDPYHCQCLKTARLLGQRLALPPQRLLVTFQSRLGRARWLEPYTEPTLRELAARGVARVDVMCPGFVADCLETLEEIALDARDAFLGAGGKTFHYLDCLNAREDWIEGLADLVQAQLAGWPTGPVTAQDEQRAELSRSLALAAGAKN